MPADYVNWKASVRALITPGVELYDRCSVHVVLYEARENSDGDNMLKSVLDAIQGVLIRNDNLKVVPRGSWSYEPQAGKTGFEIHVESC